MDEFEGLALLPLIIIDTVLSVIIVYVWFRVARARNQLNVSSSEMQDVFNYLAEKLIEQFKYTAFSLVLFSFPFIFIWLTTLVFVPTVFGEVISISLIYFLPLLVVVFIGMRDLLYSNEYDSEVQ